MSDQSNPIIQVTSGDADQGSSIIFKKGKNLTDYFTKLVNPDDQTQDRVVTQSSPRGDKDDTLAAVPVVISDSPLKPSSKKRIIEATYEDVDRILSDIKSSEAVKSDQDNVMASKVFKRQK